MQCLVNVIDYRSESGTAQEAVAIDAPDLDVALKLMGGGSKACNRRLEVWPPLQEPEQTLRMPGPRPPRRVGAGRGDNRQAVRQS